MLLYFQIEATVPALYIIAGHYTNSFGEQFPRIQILTIKDLLDGKSPNFRDLTRGSITFKKANPEKSPKGQDKLL